MVKETEPSINEKEFLLEALRQGLRVDGRRPNDMRSLKLKFRDEFGQVDVQLGRTRVMAKVSCEVVRPYPDRPTEGFLVINTEISPMASPVFESGRSSEEEVYISRIIEKSLRRSRAIDTEGLCIVAGEKVWSVRVDLHFLDHEGNLVDCACIAAITGLLHFRRPDVTVSGEEVIIHPVDERNPVPLGVHHTPVSITFAFFDNGSLLVVDPLLLEEQVLEGDMTITINGHNEICALSKAGGIPLLADQIQRCLTIAAAKTAEITEIIQRELEEDLRKKNVK
ncbi:uncharacterized protein VTP21DRAFT_8025 [Calcarisporiella thermophila]|uniref:uncharacterized protein n=1 Tax=Calcarisporiella thermophila TaxID=911321 RepID=UPI0037435B03